jgi:tetratricopeptide (TPR) repeat protein
LRGNPSAAKEVFDALRRNIDLSAPEWQSRHMTIINSEFNIEMRLGHYDHALNLAGETLKLAQADHNIRAEARAWNSMGITLISRGEWQGCAESYERSLTLARTIGERRLEGIALHTLGLTLRDQALYAEARTCQES